MAVASANMLKLIGTILSIIVITVHSTGALEDSSFELPQATREIYVASDSELAEAIDQALPGDHIFLKDGQYDGIIIQGVRGTADKPIVLRANKPRAAIIQGSRHGRNLLLSNSSHIYVSDLRFTSGQVWGVTIGPAYPRDKLVKGCSYITLINCEIDHAGQTLLKINGNSESIRILSCQIHHSGNMLNTRRPYAEGIYVGEGAVLTDRSHDILIEGNYLHSIGNVHNWGEAIDIKCQVYDVRIINNNIEDVMVGSGGAITALYDQSDYPELSNNPDILIRGNRISRVRKWKNDSHGADICIGANGITVKENIVKNTAGPAFLVLAHAANTTGSLKVVDNNFEGEVLINKHGSLLESHVDERSGTVIETITLESE